MLRAALFDLDGVLRRFPPGDHDPDGTIAAVALDPARVGPAVDGRWTFERWRDEVAAVLEREHGAPDGRAAADRFFAVDAGVVDGDVLALVRRLRAAGHPVGVLTNATSRLAVELEHLGLAEEVDVVCNSSELGVAKPDPRAFTLAAERLGVPPHGCFFTDDHPDHVAAAARLGFTAHHFTGAAGLAGALDLAFRAR